MTNKAVEPRKEGRPTKYNDSVIALAEEYISMCGREQTKLPTVEGLALHLNVDDTTLLNWANAKVKSIDKEGNECENDELLYPEFFATLKKIKMLQKEQLVNDSFYGGKEVNAAAGIFMLKANHGMKDGTGTTNVQVNVTPILSELKAE